MPIDRTDQGASALQRAVDRHAIYREARDIADSDRVMGVYAAPEYEELSDDGKEWIVAIVEETKARTIAAYVDTLADFAAWEPQEGVSITDLANWVRERACAISGAEPTSILIDPIGEHIKHKPTVFMQFSDDGQHIRKWSFEPFEAGARYIPAFVPSWDNPDGPQAA